MAKIDRIHMARGTEILTAHTHTPVTAAATALGGNVERDQMEQAWAPFDVAITVPWIDSKYFYDVREGVPPFDAPWFAVVPFAPLQEHLIDPVTGLPTTTPETVYPVLDGFSFGFDHKDEPAGILSHWFGMHDYDPSDVGFGGHGSSAGQYEPNPFEGFLCYERVAGYNFRVALFSKDQYFWNTSALPGPTTEIFNEEIPYTNWLTPETPYIRLGMGKQINPFKTYILALYAPDLHDQTVPAAGVPNPLALSQHLVLPSVQLTLHLKAPLVASDLNDPPTDEAVQNIQSVTGAQRTGKTVTTPVAGANIEADTANGFSTALAVIDRELEAKLHGGYAMGAARHAGEHLAQDAAYDIITVPLFNNLPFNQMDADTYLDMPYQNGNGAPPGGAPPEINDIFVSDRRIIPITDGFTVHHVLMDLNLSGIWSNSRGIPPLAGTQTYTVTGTTRVSYQFGVGLVTLGPHDLKRYTQVALGEFTPLAATSDLLVDYVTFPGVLGTTRSIFEAQHVLVSVPLVRGGGTGVGYWDFNVGGVNTKGIQGTPFFCGPSILQNEGTSGRTSVGKPLLPPGPPRTGACETYIEVRMSVVPKDPISVANGYDGADLFVGYGGCRAYIIGKKHLR